MPSSNSTVPAAWNTEPATDFRFYPAYKTWKRQKNLAEIVTECQKRLLGLPRTKNNKLKIDIVYEDLKSTTLKLLVTGGQTWSQQHKVVNLKSVESF